MAQALLASPSVGWHSPDHSFDDDDDDDGTPSSPRLPALDSPFSSEGKTVVERRRDDVTPTRGPMSGNGTRDDSEEFYTPVPGAVPDWMTGELAEEWPQDDDHSINNNSHDNASDVRGHDDVRDQSRLGEMVFKGSISRDKSALSIRRIHSTKKDYQPRVPSSLGRYATGAFEHDDGSWSAQQENVPVHNIINSNTLSSSATSNSAGTFVVRSNPSTTRNQAGDQIQAAVKALQGPTESAGLLGAVLQDPSTAVTPNDAPSKKTPAVKDKLGGLLSLFEPPSPPVQTSHVSQPSAPPSHLQPPTADDFTFTPPVAISRTSWKSLPHFTPSKTTESGSDSATPRLRQILEPSGTPSGPVARQAPAPKVKERYLHRPEAAEADDVSILDGPLQHAVPETPRSKAPVSTPLPASALKLFEFQYDTFTRNHLVALVDEIDNLSSDPQAFSSAVTDVAAEDRAWETSFVDVVAEGNRDGSNSSMDSVEDRAGRSSKRIRLSPSSGHSLRRMQTSFRDVDGLCSSVRRRRRSGSAATSRHARTSPDARDSVSRRRRSGDETPSQLTHLRSSATPSAQAREVRDQPGSTECGHHGMSTQERLDDANALLDRIRAKKAAREQGALHQAPSRASSQTLTVPSASRDPSPRKLLRRLSASDEVDEEVPEPILPRFAAAASASLRSALIEAAGSNASLGPSGHRGPSSHPAASASRRPLVPDSVLSQQKTGSSTARKRAQKDGAALPDDAALRTTPANVSLATARKISMGSSATTGHRKPSSLATIGPQEAESLLASASLPTRMVFDHEHKRWIKLSRAEAGPTGQQDSDDGRARRSDARLAVEDCSGSNDDDDPFRDFEIDSGKLSNGADVNRLKEARADAGGLAGLGISAGTPQAQVHVASLQVLVSPPDALYFDPLPYQERAESVEITGESDAEVLDATTKLNRQRGLTERFEDDETRLDESPLEMYRTAMRATASIQTVPRSARIVAGSRSSRTDASEIPSTPRPPTVPAAVMPRSALKQPLRSQSSSAADVGTPVSAARDQVVAGGSEIRPPRSVSFSDGKTSGKIEGLIGKSLHQITGEFDTRPGGSRLKFELSTNKSASAGEDVEEWAGEPGSLRMDSGPSLEEEDGSTGNQDFESPSSRVSFRMKGSQNSLSMGPSSASFSKDLGTSGSNASSLTLSANGSSLMRTANSISSNQVVSHSRTFRRTTRADATFLTECSFGVSADKLVQYITTVEPFEPAWERLRSISLAGKKVESVVRIDEFLPSLNELDLSCNELTFLTGVPVGVRTLMVPNNRLSGLTSFGHLVNLQRIDISNNGIDTVHQLSCLHHLREVKADGNEIADLGGLAEIDGLLRLSLRDNAIEGLDLTATKWSRLEMLNLSRNRITAIVGLDALKSISLLNLDHNQLSDLNSSSPLEQLRVLRLSHNPLESLNVTFAPRLRTLFVDSARLGAVNGTESLRKLENLSVRDQSGEALTLAMSHVRDIKRFYLSGNPIPSAFPSEKFYNLTYLELAMCQITTLPADLASVVPNVRTLNLNHNFIEDLTPLAGLSRLSKLTVVGARLSKCRPIASVFETMPELELIDLRMNPLTLSFYPPFTSPPTAILPPHAEHQILHPDDKDENEGTIKGAEGEGRAWSAIDSRFRRALPNEYYCKRSTYRAIMLQVVPTLRKLDGLECGVKERAKLAKVVDKMARRKQV